MQSPWSIYRTFTREMNVFIGASMISAIGSALMWPLTTMFVYSVLERSQAEAGFVIFMQMLGGVLGQFVGGSLYYRLGVRRLLIGSLAVASCLQVSLIVTAYGEWWIYVTAMFLLGLMTSMSMPAIQSFIGFRWAERRTELFSAIYAANNLGVAIGTALAGVLAAISFNFSFFINGMTSAAFALFFYFYLKNWKEDGMSVQQQAKLQSKLQSKQDDVHSDVGHDRADTQKNTKSSSIRRMTIKISSDQAHVSSSSKETSTFQQARVSSDEDESGVLSEQSLWYKLKQVHIYLFMALGSLCIWFANSMWNSGVSPHITDEKMEPITYSALWTLNGLVIFFGQPFIMWLKSKIAKLLTSQLIWSAVFYSLAYMVMLIFPFYPGFVLAMVLATIGEMLVSPAVPAFIADKAGRGAPFYMGLTGGIGWSGRMIGPLLLGITYDYSGLTGVAAISLVVAVAAIASYATHASLQKRGRQLEKSSETHSFDRCS
ncbi:MFS transporter [Paenibacillus sp. 481]|nr:MFS transporter [Paenibacillus sp. 481]